ncbi:MAG: hypothetical protein OXT70_06660 [Chloroflexota bacterium]|nr:hypothetical protein [Chloroflexota bacterium]
MATETCKWDGHSFNVHTINTNWNDVGGVYIFAGKTTEGRWRAYYIGETKSLKDRLTPIGGHEKWATAKRRGATHVHARAVSTQTQRKQLEKDLISKYQPAGNQQGR